MFSIPRRTVSAVAALAAVLALLGCGPGSAADEAPPSTPAQVLTAALGDGLSQGRELSTAAVAYARKWFTKPGAEPDLEPGGAVGAGAQEVAEKLQQPEIGQLLQRFDGKVDAALASAR